MAERGEREIHFPAPVIHRIQSFLNGKQAAQTALVSKSWFDAWLTRPDLYCNESRFFPSHDFWTFADKTVQRYQELNLNFNSLYLRLQFDLVNDRRAELIRKVQKLGVNGIDCKIKTVGLDDKCLHVLETDTIMRLALLDDCLSPRHFYKFKWSGLKSLRLERVLLAAKSFRNAFPSLEDLTLVHCRITGKLQISSTSLKFISITSEKSFGGNDAYFKAWLKVPNIRKFIFFGPCIPLLSLAKVPREWEAEISIEHSHREIIWSWYDELKLLLTRLGQSMCKVSLSIRFYGDGYGLHIGYSAEHKLPTVDNLMLSLPSIFYGTDTLFYTLLWHCRPKVITQYWFSESNMGEKGNNKLIRYMCKKMFKDWAVHPYCSIKDVKVENFQESLGEWQPLQWTNLLHGYKVQRISEKSISYWIGLIIDSIQVLV